MNSRKNQTLVLPGVNTVRSPNGINFLLSDCIPKLSCERSSSLFSSSIGLCRGPLSMRDMDAQALLRSIASQRLVQFLLIGRSYTTSGAATCCPHSNEIHLHNAH